MVGEVNAFERLAAALHEAGRIPTVAADQYRFEAELFDHARDDRRGGVKAGREDDVGLRSLDREQLRADVLITGAIPLLDNDAAAVPRERIREELSQYDRVVVLVVEDQRGRFCFQFARSEISNGFAFGRADEARTKDVVTLLRQFRLH